MNCENFPEGAMLKNYIKIAIRNMFRNRLYSLINLFGLALGLAACLTIWLWVQDELSYDRFHTNAERIYRVERRVDFRDLHGQSPTTAGAYGPALVRDYPEIMHYARLHKNELSIKDQKNVFHKQQLIVADNSIFEIFDFHLERGDPKTALTQPKSMVLSRANALKYLGTEDAVGKSITVDWGGTLADFQITGILEEIPHNSHVRFDVLASISSYPQEQINTWSNNFLYTYVLVQKGTDTKVLENKFSGFLTKYMAADFAKILGPEADVNKIYQLKLYPLLDIHLHPAQEFEIEPQGSLSSVYIFSAIAVLILVIACINFMSLSTARANKRSREVGIRKTVGAQKNQLRGQFLGESVLLAFMAFILAVLLIRGFIPVFNSISGKALSLGALFQASNWVILVGITLAAGLLAGLYPALYLTRFDPAKVLKEGAQSGSGKSVFRRSMALFQFVISIALIIGTLIIFKQMEFVQNKSLGFDKENVVLLPADSRTVHQKFDAFRNVLTEDSRIKSVAVSSNVPGSAMFSDTAYKRPDTDEVFSLVFMSVDYDFVDTYGFEVVQGRAFSKEFSTDSAGAIMINRAAAREIGYPPEEAVGKKLLRFLSFDEFKEFTIVGVVEDFHFKSLHRIIEPCLFVLDPDRFDLISIRIMAGDVRGTLGFTQKKWGEIFPGEQFEYSFLDNRIDLLYKSEGRMRSIFLIFSILSVFVACLGLFGLATFTAEERIKEIGVRKVLGASATNIFILLSKEFSRWVLVANLFAWPVAYLMMNRWLQNFAYRTDIGLWPFLLSALLIMIISLVTVSYQSVKAAMIDPADCLKYE
jgi:putative ABC transport system permease protein